MVQSGLPSIFPRGRVAGGWGGRGTPDFKWQGWSNRGENQKPKKVPADQNLAPKKSHAEFPSLKNFQIALNDITRKTETLVLNTPKKSLLKSSYPKKNTWPKFSYPQKIPKLKNNISTPPPPPKILQSSLSLEIWSTPLGNFPKCTAVSFIVACSHYLQCNHYFLK